VKLVVTHEQPDFDALASVALAKLAHPGSAATLTGTLSSGLRKLTVLYRDELNLLEASQIDLNQVTELIIVDTNDPRRIRPFDQLLGKVPVTVYDHHPLTTGSIEATHGIQEQVGAAATLLTRHLKASNTPIPASTASLALLGIHADTGHLTYSGTTGADYHAAAHLLASGANLQFVTEHLREPFTPAQRAFLNRIMSDARLEQDGDNQLLTAALTLHEYVPGASGLVSQALELQGADAAVITVNMDGPTLIFARVLEGYDAAAAFSEEFGTGGHPGAAFARSDQTAEQALQRAVTALKRHRDARITAADLMTSPVTTIPASSTVAQARQLLQRHGHNGAPVTDSAGRLQGVISRRDIERALRFDLDTAPITGFMTRDLILASPTDSLGQLEELIISNNIGRLPVISAGRLVGIVTRTDLLRARHPHAGPDSAQLVINRLPGFASELLASAARLLPAGASLYLVGGTVRDALLGRALTDFDLAVEGMPAARLAELLQKHYGGTLTQHGTFGTTTLALDNDLAIDIATARDETYAHPGALPEVAPSSISRDLNRRDFTVNALAVRIQPAPLQLLDPFNGQADLQKQLLRPLHPLSFLDDPTRILRGARLAGRLGFSFTPSAQQQAQLALTRAVLDRMTNERLRNELQLTFMEARVEPAVDELVQLGALRAMFSLDADPALLAALDALRARQPVDSEAYLLALLLATPQQGALEHIRRFHWPSRLAASLERLRLAAGDPAALTEDVLARTTAAERAVLKGMGPAWREQVAAFEALPQRRKLRGSDVLELGLPSGPLVGQLLAAVSRARQAGQVDSFEAELELARSLIPRLSGAMNPKEPPELE
jgi:tRNA nucleotidyltransferase (CCA-adding enzyme)